MERYGVEIAVDQELIDTLAVYMVDEKRERVHFEIAPCEPDVFLMRYLELDPDFEEVLKSEFSIRL